MVDGNAAGFRAGRQLLAHCTQSQGKRCSQMKRNGLPSGYTGSGAMKVMRWWMLGCLLLPCFAQAQDESGRQTLSRAVELHQPGPYAEAITEYQPYFKTHPKPPPLPPHLSP